jgi:putative DNA primase/helicase
MADDKIIALAAYQDDEKQQEITEDALALRFSERHADELRYIAVKGEWRKWSGNRWHPDATLLGFDLARQCCRDVAAELCNGKPLKHILNAKTIAAVERMAKADRRHATTIDQWDANDLDFNAAENPDGYVQP